RAVFLDTPAGFQLNADEMSAKAVEYFRKRFSVSLAVASFKDSSLLAGSTSAEAALAIVRQANYVFAGPGSPTYAARHLLNSPVAAALKERLAAGSQMVFASAAAIAASRHVVPVYEIYKVGEEPHWVEGIDLLGPYACELAIVTHWDNREGGTHDTRYAYLGEARLKVLEEALPQSAVILGVDEHTACIIDLSVGRCDVMGVGGVTIRQRGRELAFPSGSSFTVEYLVHGPEMGCVLPPEAPHEVTTSPHGMESQQPLAEVIEERASALETGLIELLIEVRHNLRQNRQWEMADRIRRRIASHDIILEDTAEGTRWRRS
ncbi:MAG: hypothetical protein ABIH46_07090, partial [Chloroflexota bacterium]